MDGLSIMGQDPNPYLTKRRFPRIHGPFDGYYETPQTPVLIYDLNLGGGFVQFGGDHPAAVAFALNVALPDEGVVTVQAETIYRLDSGVAVRFVGMDIATLERMERAIGTLIHQRPTH